MSKSDAIIFDFQGGSDDHSLHHCTITNTDAVTVAGVTTPSAKRFNGTSAYLSVTHDTLYNAYPLTIEAVVKVPETGLYKGLVAKYVAASNNGYALLISDSRVQAWYQRDNDNKILMNDYGIDGDEISAFWHVIHFVVDSTGGALYVDGELRNSVAWTGTAGACTTTQNLEINRYGTNYLESDTDSVRLYSRGLSAYEIWQRYLAVAPVLGHGGSGAIPSTPVYDIIGVEWNQGTDTWRHIDEDGNTITLTTTDFDKHPVWGQMKRCLLTAAGVATYGENARGDGLDLTGEDGRVMVRIPQFYAKSANPSANVYQWWISHESFSGASIHPAFYQRGGGPHDQVYVGAYAADFYYDGDNEAYDADHLKLHSRTGKQPYSGSGDCIWLLSIDDLANEPHIGDVVAGTEGGFIIADYVKTAGAWGGGGAGDTAYIWVQKPGDDSCGILNGDALTNTTMGGIAIGNVTAAPAGRNVTIGDCRTLGENIGAGWGQQSIWGWSAWVALWFIENATGDSQTALGRGIVDKASGTGFAGELNGADSADTNIAANGTGTGTGVDGLTPIVYRGIENPWGNVWQFIDGYNAVDAEYRVINRDGTGTFADTLAGGDYEASSAAPITSDGYISNIVYESLLGLLWIPSAVAGSSSTYLRDYWYAHDAGETNILLAGGYWPSGDRAGVAYRSSDNAASLAYRTVGARVEFIG